MQKAPHKIYVFGDFTLDLKSGCLLRKETEVRLRPKSFEVLTYLVENSGRLVSKDELIGAVWPATFVTDDSLVKCLKDVRVALEDDLQQHVKTVPRRGYVFTIKVRESESVANPASLPTTLQEQVKSLRVVIQEERNDEGVASGTGELVAALPPAQLPHPGWAKPFRGATLVIALGVLVLSSAALLAYRDFSNNPRRDPNAPITSIAVLPLRNLSGDPSNDYFSDGMTESLITALSKVEGLTVISRGSVFRFNGEEVDPQYVGSQLGVAAVLEGTVMKSGEMVRVGVRLVSAADGRVLWSSDPQDRALGDIFAVQDEVARRVVSGLSLKLGREGEQRLAKRYTDNVEAYQAYLKGRYFWNKRTEAGLKKSIEYFDQAIAKDAQFALAHAGLADSYAVFNLYGTAQLPDALPKARDAAQRALVLDDTLAEAHTVLALVKEQYEWDWAGAELEFQRAIELNPNYATAHQYYSEFLAFRGRTEESLAHIKQAHNLDPFSLIINTTLGYPYLCARRCDLAVKEFRKAREMDPNFPLAIFYTARCYELEGTYDQAIAEYRQAVALSGRSSLTLAGLGHAYAKSGRGDQARAVLDELTEMSKSRSVSPYLIGTVYVGLGENDQALEWLEKARREHDYLLVLLKVDARLDGLRKKPRFLELQRRIGLE